MPALSCPAGENPGNIINTAAMCPWTYQVDSNSTRQPTNIDIAVPLCHSCLDPYTNEAMLLTTCAKVTYPVPVIVDGEEVVFDAPVAYTCLRLNAVQIPVLATDDSGLTT